MPPTTLSWLDDAESRVGLGCMRLSSAGFAEDDAVDTIATAVEAGMTVFDTAHAYAPLPTAGGHNERLLARAIRASGAVRRVRVVTKGGMTRAGPRWIPDGRAREILAGCEASLEALDGLPIDLYLLHAPDPRTSWSTSVRALARLARAGLARYVGVANVNRRQLEEALDLAPITAVQVSLSVFDDSAVRGGIVGLCEQKGLRVIAHSPLGGPRRAPSLARRRELVELADRLDATPAEVALAWVLGVSPAVVAIAGARSPGAARSAARAAGLKVSPDARARLEAAIHGRAEIAGPRRRTAARREVVMIMGIPGAGKSRLAAAYVSHGYARLNRDEEGGSLRSLAAALARRLAEGETRVVLDNTYLTRASRSHVVDAARHSGADVHCTWIDTPLAEAQVNMVLRLLDRFGSLPPPESVREASRREPGLHLPATQMRTFRELEPPSAEEGFAGIERVPFSRDVVPGTGGSAVVVAASVLSRGGWEAALSSADRGAPHLLFDWLPEGQEDDLVALSERLGSVVEGAVEVAICPHPGGPPACWCRPPLPGLPLAFMQRHRVEPRRVTLVGTSATHRALASALGARLIEL